MKNFVSVSTNAARFQDISLNPQKLAGMCAKLKCCLNYEVDDYVEAGKRIPPRDIVLQTQDSDYYQFKTDILAGLITYSTDKHLAANLETISAQRAQQIIAMNRRGEKPLSLLEDNKSKTPNKPKDLLEDDINRFDKAKHKKKNALQDVITKKQTLQTMLLLGQRTSVDLVRLMTTRHHAITISHATIIMCVATIVETETNNANKMAKNAMIVSVNHVKMRRNQKTIQRQKHEDKRGVHRHSDSNAVDFV